MFIKIRKQPELTTHEKTIATCYIEKSIERLKSELSSKPADYDGWTIEHDKAILEKVLERLDEL